MKKGKNKCMTIMVQGTMSNVGKSIVATGLCRIFKQDGYKTLPFKSQNMSSNSYVLDNGLEISTAQAVQAYAAGARPCEDMNPVLLKPSSDTGSEVILEGKSIGNMTAADYFFYKKKLVPRIMNSFKKLSDSAEIVVIEGAGSPAEINLNSNDIVNMGMAKMADSPVILVADIDRGGVFATIYGTVMLLKEEERRMIKALIVNKFRGDFELLKPGLSMIEQLTGIPVIGTIPHIDLDIEPEDSLCSKRVSRSESSTGTDDRFEYMETEFDKLANVMRKNIDIDKLYKIMESSIQVD